jgi:BirA family biotin operon repressor/biotin-[acetyl-CoA-carboxylase] ligase
MPALTLDLDRLRRDSFVAAVERHATLTSTNDRALELAALEALDVPLLILADEQTAGRGRGKNHWWSGAGALTFSLVFDPARVGAGALRAEHWPRVALTAGVALCDALGELAPHLDFGLKWPNDVLLSGKKVAGILVEIPPARPPVPRRLVLGMGLNVNNSLADAPAEIQSVGTALCDATGLEFDPAQVLLTWLAAFDASLRALAAGDPALPTRWRSRCVLSGKRVELKAAERTVHGMCRGIDDEGALLLETASGVEKLFAGVLVRASD